MRDLSKVTTKAELAFQSVAGILPEVFLWLCVDNTGLSWAKNWGRLPYHPHLSSVCHPKCPCAISCRSPDFIVGDLSLVFTTDLSEGLLTISETLRKARDLFVILARSQISSEPGSPEPGGGTPCRRGRLDREWQDRCWRVPARMSLDLGICVAQPVAEGERGVPGHARRGRLAGAHVCAWGLQISWAPRPDSVPGGNGLERALGGEEGRESCGLCAVGSRVTVGTAYSALLNAGHCASVLIRY